MNKQAVRQGISIGTTVDAGSAKSITDGIIAIIKASPDPAIVRHALDVFRGAFKIENITLSNVVIRGDRTINIADDADEDGDFGSDASVHRMRASFDVGGDADGKADAAP